MPLWPWWLWWRDLPPPKWALLPKRGPLLANWGRLAVAAMPLVAEWPGCWFVSPDGRAGPYERKWRRCRLIGLLYTVKLSY